MKRIAAFAAVTALLTTALAACATDESSTDGSTTVKVTYQKYGDFLTADNHFQAVKKEFEASHEGVKIDLVPIKATEKEYFTKLALANRSASTAPDVMYQDTFRIKADAEAGYLLPLDDYLADWDEWDQYYDNAKEAGTGTDGKTYGVSMGTDTRGLWYNKELFAKAGLPVPWEPQNWEDVLSAARTIKEKLPEDIVPLNVYSGKSAGEGASMQGFEMLLYGTNDTLYSETDNKWVTGSQGFVDSLEFIDTIFTEELTPTVQEALDPNLWSTIEGQWMPQSKLAIALDGSWLPGTWMEKGSSPWPEWDSVLGVAPMPTQNGQEPGATSMSGGWTLAVAKNSKVADLAWEFIALALNKDNSTAYDVAAGQLPVRTDVAENPTFVEESNSTTPTFATFVEFTHFRPATSDYTKVSSEIQAAMEAVMTGDKTPQEAAANYDAAVIKAVGEENTTS